MTKSKICLKIDRSINEEFLKDPKRDRLTLDKEERLDGKLYILQRN